MSAKVFGPIPPSGFAPIHFCKILAPLEPLFTNISNTNQSRRGGESSNPINIQSNCYIGQDKKRLNLIFSINKGQKYRISKINFIGDKKIKFKRLRDVIASEEHRFWKFISRNVYLNAERIELDKRLLKNFYLSKGYYNVEIISSSAESKDNNTDIELTYSINAGDRYRIKKLSTDIDPVFDNSIFEELKDEFTAFAGEYYSPFKIQKILTKIDKIVDQNELQFVQHTVKETVDEKNIDIIFKIFEGPKIQIERVNIFGNTVTSDSVIRSELELDEGDPYSKVKLNQSVSISGPSAISNPIP